jgi:hypothetical protein
MDLCRRQGRRRPEAMAFQYDSGSLLLYRNSKGRTVAVESVRRRGTDHEAGLGTGHWR